MLECVSRHCDSFQALYLPCTGQHDRQSGQCTDHDRIDKGSCHTHKSLTHRLLCLGCCRCDRCTTKTSLIGENTSRHTFLHSDKHAADHASGDCFRIKGCHNDRLDRHRHCCDVAQNQNNCKYKINNRHKRYDDLAHTRNTLHTTDQYGCHTECQHQ